MATKPTTLDDRHDRNHRLAVPWGSAAVETPRHRHANPLATRIEGTGETHVP
jgi:hypothetical protein